jgi:outer membrane protein TolC
MKRTVVLRSVTKLCFQALACTTLFQSASAQTAAVSTAIPGPTLSLRQAFDEALLQNRDIQVQRIEQEVADFAIGIASAYYDPILTSRAHLESATDTGGFDPANFSADAIFEADSEVLTTGLIGFLPSGLTYTLGGNYAHSAGTRNGLNFDSYKVTTAVTVEQPLLRNAWIDAPRWAIKVSKQNLKVSELGVLFIAMSVVNFTQQAYYDLAFAWENLQIHKNLYATRQEFLAGIRQQVQFGIVTAPEEKLAQSQVAAIRTDLIGASNEVALASNNLRALMGTTPDTWTTQPLIPSDKLITIPEIFDLSQSWRSGLRLRPDLLQLAINLETADLTVKFRKNQLLPSLNLFGSYGLRGSDAIQAFPPSDPKARSSFAFREVTDQDAPNSAVGVLFSVPLSFRAERANYKTSKERKKQAEVLLKQKEELILREVADAIDLARFSYERADAAREAVQFAEEALRAEESRLKTGAGSIFLVLEAQSDLAAARIVEAEVRRDYNKAISQLYFAEGSLLDRIQLDVRFQ